MSHKLRNTTYFEEGNVPYSFRMFPEFDFSFEELLKLAFDS
jgi:hypothetical protein